MKLPDGIADAASDSKIFEKLAMMKNGNSTNEEKKVSYARPEDSEKNRDGTKGDASWEARVQWEGQMNGNQFKQNEILRKI